MRISAYVPCYNNSATLASTLRSIQKQSVSVDELFVVDDGSTDNSTNIAEKLGCRVIRHEKNLGRGAVRARAMKEASGELVLSCDSTIILPEDFLKHILHWFDSKNVCAVFGRIAQQDNSTLLERWRGRHLFKINHKITLNRHATLATGGAVLRKSYALEVGNFDNTLHHSEDADLGARLLSKGYEVVFDPGLEVISNESNSFPELMERYWRWYAGKEEPVSWRGYIKQIVYSLKVMAMDDLRARDPFSIPISLFSPHYQFWKSCWQRLRQPNQQRK